MKTVIAVVLLACLPVMAAATPVFSNGLVLPGNAGDSIVSTANSGRLGYFSDLAYDASSRTWLALSDRGPGGGTIAYETRLERFRLDIDSVTGGISGFRVVQTVKFTCKNSQLNGLAPDPKETLGSSFDPEGLAVSPRNGHFFVSDEYGPSVVEFDSNGVCLRRFETPANIVPRDEQGFPNYASNSGNVAGRVANRGFEGLTLTPDGKFLFAILQSAMLDEGGRNGSVTRIVKFSVKTGKAVAQYAYAMESNANGVSALVALNDHQFLVLERNSFGIGVGGTNQTPEKWVFKIDLKDASDVSAISFASDADFKLVDKTLWLDLAKDRLAAFGNQVPEKFEGLAFGPRLQDGSVLLLAGTDNDYSVTQNGARNQMDAYFNFADPNPDVTEIDCELDKKTGCIWAKDGSPATLTDFYVLLPGVLMAWRVPSAEFSN